MTFSLIDQCVCVCVGGGGGGGVFHKEIINTFDAGGHSTEMMRRYMEDLQSFRKRTPLGLPGNAPRKVRNARAWFQAACTGKIT